MFSISSFNFVIYLKNCGQAAVLVKRFDVLFQSKNVKKKFWLQPRSSVELNSPSIFSFKEKLAFDCTVEIEVPDVGTNK